MSETFQHFGFGRAEVPSFGHLRTRAMAASGGERLQTVRLIFDYQHINNYKAAGLRTDAGQQKWVLKAVVNDVKSDPSAELRAGIGNYYEKNLSTGIVTKYYYANGQRACPAPEGCCAKQSRRVAERQGSTV